MQFETRKGKAKKQFQARLFQKREGQAIPGKARQDKARQFQTRKFQARQGRAIPGKVR